MKDRPGSYIDDGKGTLTPNMADEAMSARHGKGKGTETKPNAPAASETAADDATAKDKKVEVKTK